MVSRKKMLNRDSWLPTNMYIMKAVWNTPPIWPRAISMARASYTAVFTPPSAAAPPLPLPPAGADDPAGCKAEGRHNCTMWMSGVRCAHARLHGVQGGTTHLVKLPA
jgi:hypothetical protein